MFDILVDPFERGDTSMLYDSGCPPAYLNYRAVALVAEWLQSFKEFPPRQKPASFNLDEVMRKLSTPNPGRD